MLSRYRSVLMVALVLIAALALPGCEEKTPEAANTAGGTAAQLAPPQQPYKEQTPEQRAAQDTLVKAIGEIAALLDANMEDADQALAAVRGYYDANKAELKAAVEVLRAYDASLTPAEQEAYRSDQTGRDEYVRYQGAFESFEAKHPDQVGELEALLDEIQNTGLDDAETVEDATAQAAGDADALIAQADAALKALEGLELGGLDGAALEAKLTESYQQALSAHESYEKAYQATSDNEKGITALVRAGDVHMVMADKIGALTAPEGMDAAAFARQQQTYVGKHQGLARTRYEAALKLAGEHSVTNAQTARATAALSKLEAVGGESPDGE